MKRGRKSAASLEIATASRIQTIERPQCPHDLNDEEAEVWFTVINRLPADWFPAETHPLLIGYCRAVIQARRIAEWMERATSDPELVFSDYAKILKQQREQHASIAMLATKMRISQQATTNHRGNHKQISPAKPWES